MSASPDGAAVIAASRLLGDMLDTDIGGYTPAIRAIDEALAAVHAGHHPGAIHGNVYTLTLTHAEARIANARDHAVPHETIPLADFAAAWTHWRR